jgi:hypothetical protein
MACAHELCRCEVATIDREDNEFCSEHCAEVVEGAAHDQEACTCGHVDCMTTEVTPGAAR